MIVMPREARFLEFVRLPSFERTVDGVLSEEDIRELEMILLAEPRKGRVVQDTAASARYARHRRGEARAAARA